MGQIEPHDALDFQSSKRAQDAAVRLICMCSAVLPSDQNLRRLVDDQIIGEMLELGFHGRRFLERRGLVSSSIGDGALWPNSKVAGTGESLKEVFGKIIHSNSIVVKWEKVTDFDETPYSGRSPNFAGSIVVTSDKPTENYPIAGIVTAFIQAMNNSQPKTDKGVN